MEKPKLHVMHVDDDRSFRFILNTAFTNNHAHPDHDYTVTSFADGAAALQALYRHDATLPDVILLDVTMPGMSGNEVLQQLKRDPKTKDIPVIFLSANDLGASLVGGQLQAQNAAACESLGIIGQLNKQPVDQLAKNVSDLLAHHQAQTATSQPAFPTTLVSTAAIAALQPTTQPLRTAAAVTNLR